MYLEQFFVDEIGLHRPRLGQEVAGHTIAGVVDQHVDGQAASLDFLNQHARRLAVGEIGADDFHTDSVGANQFPGQRLQALDATGGQQQVMAARRQFACKGGADACRSTRNQGKAGFWTHVIFLQRI